jgi:hypothetical protein
MGQSRRSFIVKVNLQVGWQVFLPGEKILSNVIAQPLKIMSRNIGAAVPRESQSLSKELLLEAYRI